METKLVKMGDAFPLVLGERVLREEELPRLDEKEAARAMFEIRDYDPTGKYENKCTWGKQQREKREEAKWAKTYAALTCGSIEFAYPIQSQPSLPPVHEMRAERDSQVQQLQQPQTAPAEQKQAAPQPMRINGVSWESFLEKYVEECRGIALQQNSVEDADHTWNAFWQREMREGRLAPYKLEVESFKAWGAKGFSIPKLINDFIDYVQVAYSATTYSVDMDEEIDF